MTENDDDLSPGDFQKVRSLIESIRIGILTTVDPQGGLHARPLQTLEVEGTEALWFFTDWSSPKVGELTRDRRVSLGYADPAKHTFVTVSGSCSLLKDADKARALWSAEQLAFYPAGPDDSRLALLRVSIDRAEYWIAPGRTSYLVSAAKAAISGEPAGIVGENRKVK